MHGICLLLRHMDTSPEITVVDVYPPYLHTHTHV